jgi:hypothetical protein
MPETFVPLVTGTAKPSEFTTMNLKVLPQAAVKPANAAFQKVTLPTAPAHNSETCAKPNVTLQRTGELVTAIRVECGCGQVIELSCVY